MDMYPEVEESFKNIETLKSEAGMKVFHFFG